MLDAFFKACGWSVCVLRERAAECPLTMKGHFFFNSWTTTTMMAGLLEVVDQPTDLVILDRGFFDALVWLKLQQTRGQVTAQQAQAFADFVLLDRWGKLVDLTVVMKVSPDIALKREHAGMFNILELNADTPNQKELVASLVGELLGRVQDWADPEIAIVPRSQVSQMFSASPAVAWSVEAWRQLANGARFVKRSVAEKDDALVQIVACGVPVREDGVIVFDRTRDKKRLDEYGAAQRLVRPARRAWELYGWCR
jgi:hypothetical protein